MNPRRTEGVAGVGQGAVRIIRVAALLVAFTALAGPTPPLYTLVPITAPGGGATRAWALNNHGVVVGEAETGENEVNAFVWSQAEGLRILGTLGGSNSRALDINDQGQVVGESETAAGVMRAFTWTAATGLRALPATTSAVHSTAIAVNERGQVVGMIEDEDGQHAAWWSDDAVHLLPRLPGAGSFQALDVNAAGDVVGQIQTGAEEAFVGHAFYFPSALEARNLTDFRLVSAFAGSAAVALNDHGEAAGYTMVDSARVRAFRYRPGAGFTLLEDHRAQYSNARELNAGGDIVGSIIPSYWSDELACAWLDGRWFDLNEITETGPDWWLVQANGINRRRDIAGYGLFGERHTAFLLVFRPDAAPGSWPAPALEVRDVTEPDQHDRSAILRVEPPASLPVRRVLFLENGTVIGAVDEPPFEWGWHGSRDGAYEFMAELLDDQGRRYRTPRRFLDPVPE